MSPTPEIVLLTDVVEDEEVHWITKIVIGKRTHLEKTNFGQDG